MIFDAVIFLAQHRLWGGCVLEHCLVVTEHVNMRSLYHNAITKSTVSLSAVNSDPKVDVLTKFCFLLSHITGARLQNINIPVLKMHIMRQTKSQGDKKQEY